MEEEKKTPEREEEQALPVQELPTDIPAEVRQKLAEDLNEQATEDLKQDVREAEKEEANDEEVKANPEMLTKSRLLKLLVKKQYVKLREVTEEEQPADLAELLEELDENNRLVVFRLLKKDVATEAFAYMSDEARDDLVNAFSDVELVSAIEDMSLDDAADLLEDMPAGVVKRVLEKSSRQTRESLNKLLNYPESSAGSLMTPEYVRLRQEMTVSDAFAAIRKQGENAETVYTCYVFISLVFRWKTCDYNVVHFKIRLSYCRFRGNLLPFHFTGRSYSSNFTLSLHFIDFRCNRFFRSNFLCRLYFRSTFHNHLCRNKTRSIGRLIDILYRSRHKQE